MWLGWEGLAAFVLFSLVGIERVCEVLAGCVQLTHEGLGRSHELSEKHRTDLILARKSREGVLDLSRIEELVIEDSAFDLKLLMSVTLLTEGADDLCRRRGILVRPRDRRHSLETITEIGLRERVAFEGLPDDVVLDDLVIDAHLAETLAQIGDQADVYATKVQKDHGRCAIDAFSNDGRFFDLLLTRHHHLTPPTGPTADRREGQGSSSCSRSHYGNRCPSRQRASAAGARSSTPWRSRRAASLRRSAYRSEHGQYRPFRLGTRPYPLSPR